MPKVSSTTPAEVFYSIDGVGLALRAAPLAVSDQLRSRLRAFLSREGPVEICVELLAAADPSAAIARPHGRARMLFEPEYALEYFPDIDQLRFADRAVAGLCDPATSGIRIVTTMDDERASFIASHLFFNLALLELLKRRNRFAIHAGVVERDGRAVIIAGPSGAGKTTLALACALGGFALLSDDLVLLRHQASADLRIEAFPDEIDVSDDTLAFFPELGRRMARIPSRVSGKRSLHSLDLGTRIAWTAAPAALVFPSVTRSRPALLRPISRDDALVRLVPNVIRTEVGAAQRHLDALAALARATPSFELEIADPLEAPALFSDLIQVR